MKPDGYKLSEFIETLKVAFEMGIPKSFGDQMNLGSSLVEEQIDSSAVKLKFAHNNLFEHF